MNPMGFCVNPMGFIDQPFTYSLLPYRCFKRLTGQTDYHQESCWIMNESHGNEINVLVYHTNNKISKDNCYTIQKTHNFVNDYWRSRESLFLRASTSIKSLSSAGSLLNSSANSYIFWACWFTSCNKIFVANLNRNCLSMSNWARDSATSPQFHFPMARPVYDSICNIVKIPQSWKLFLVFHLRFAIFGFTLAILADFGWP